MWPAIATLFLFAPRGNSVSTGDGYIFSKSHLIFTSAFNITSLLVPADGSKYIQAESSDLPSVFFTAEDPRFDGGSCIFVLEDLAAYEILEGGRDTTADYGSDRTVYLGAKDGLYKYDPESLSAKKLGPFRDDIIQLQKANGTDVIYYLNQEHRMYKLEKGGTVKSKVQNVVCATQFVLDTSNNLYYVQCGDKMIYIIKSDGTVPAVTASVLEEFHDVKLLRPAFIMDDCIPFFGDGTLHILYSNGTTEKKDFFMVERPSAYSVDATLYLVTALNGKIYEYNVMEMMLKSMFGMGSSGLDVGKIIMSIISSKDNIFGVYKGWYQY